MSLHCAKRVLHVKKLQDKIRSWCLAKDMEYLADSTAELCKDGKDLYMGL